MTLRSSRVAIYSVFSPALLMSAQLPSNSPLHNHIARNTSARINIAHPYARLFAKKDEVKRRKIWNHVLEKAIFSSYELYVAFPNVRSNERLSFV